MESTVREAIGDPDGKKDINPRFLVRYTFENEKVKHLVSLYVICIRTEEDMERFKQPEGKLWTSKQIEENMDSGIFSEYFEYKGEWFAFYHNSALSNHDWLRSICVDKLYYNEDGTIQMVKQRK